MFTHTHQPCDSLPMAVQQKYIEKFAKPYSETSQLRISLLYLFSFFFWLISEYTEVQELVFPLFLKNKLPIESFGGRGYKGTPALRC